MRALVVHESMFGNTRAVAQEVAAGLATWCDVDVVPVAQVQPRQVADADLLVVGTPTHAWGLPSPKTRQGAVEQTSPAKGLLLEPGATGPGVRELLTGVAGAGRAAAAFDTRICMLSMVTGRASVRIARALRRRGWRVVTSPESFLVTKQTQLVAGELERARAWGAGLSVARADAEDQTV